MNDSVEYLVLANVPHDPDAARLMQDRVASGEVVVHPSYKKEILTKLEDAVAGRLALGDQDDESNLSLDLDFDETSLAKVIKSLSAAEFEAVLQAFFAKRSDSAAAINVSQFAQKASGRSENNEFEISLTFKVAGRASEKDQ